MITWLPGGGMSLEGPLVALQHHRGCFPEHTFSELDTRFGQASLLKWILHNTVTLDMHSEKKLHLNRILHMNSRRGRADAARLQPLQCVGSAISHFAVWHIVWIVAIHCIWHRKWCWETKRVTAEGQTRVIITTTRSSEKHSIWLILLCISQPRRSTPLKL